MGKGEKEIESNIFIQKPREEKCIYKFIPYGHAMVGALFPFHMVIL